MDIFQYRGYVLYPRIEVVWAFSERLQASPKTGLAETWAALQSRFSVGVDTATGSVCLIKVNTILLSFAGDHCMRQLLTISSDKPRES